MLPPMGVGLILHNILFAPWLACVFLLGMTSQPFFPPLIKHMVLVAFSWTDFSQHLFLLFLTSDPHRLLSDEIPAELQPVPLPLP